MAAKKPKAKRAAKTNSKKKTAKRGAGKLSLPKAPAPDDKKARTRQDKFRVLLANLMAYESDASTIAIDGSAPWVVRIHAALAETPLVPTWIVTLPAVDTSAAEVVLAEVNERILKGSGIQLELNELIALGLLMRGEVFRWLAPYWSGDINNASQKIDIW